MSEPVKLSEFHSSDFGKKWLYWLSLTAVSLTVLGYLHKLTK